MNPSTAQERYKREAEFHDKVFSDKDDPDSARKAADKFYAVTAASKTFFRSYLVAHCGRRVLEYGCGPHTHAILLKSKDAAVTGIDISPVAVAQRRSVARQHDLTVYGSVMNGEQLAFANGSFDLVCGTGILHHLDLELCFRELSRVLKPSGKAIFIEPLGHNPLVNLYRRLTPAMRSVDEHPLMAADFDRAREHFGRLELTYFHLSSLAMVPFRRFSWFERGVRLMDGVDRALFRIMPWLGRHAWAVVMVMAEPKQAKP